jgi:L-2-hydroxyglutarate oxidase LhgO
MADSVAVVGAGLVGLAVGRALAQRGERVAVFEKESAVAVHQSGHNSGVVHSGVYYAPGSLKATLCRRGVGLLKAFCVQHELEYREIGKLIVARNEVEVARLKEIETRAHLNGVPGVRWVQADQIDAIEPNVRGVAALHSPTTAIVDYRAIARRMADDITDAGGRVEFDAVVSAIDCVGDSRVAVAANGERETFGRLVICAGLQSDRVARLAGDTAAPMIVPFRGEYYRLGVGRRDLVRGLVYPVPDPGYPFLGVHITPRVDGSVDIGPNAVLAAAREGYRRADVNLADVREAATFPGTRKLFRQHWRVGVQEMKGSLSKRTFIAAARDYVPAIRAQDVVRAPAGVRAQAVDADGSLVDDFRINQIGAVTAVRNAPSPAATSSLAIAEHIVAGMYGPPAPTEN